MSKLNKKSINWLVDEFTSIDLVPAILPGKVKSSETLTVLEEDGEKHSYVSSRTENDANGRPSVLKNYNQNGELTEEYKYQYSENLQKIDLYEHGKKSCTWTYEYNAKQLLIKSEYAEAVDDSRDLDAYEYNESGHLTRILMEAYPQEVDEEEPATGYELEWNGDKLMTVSEFYGDEEEARIKFEYNDKGQVSAVKKIIFLVDDDDEDVEEIFDEQMPKYDNKGRLIENAITYHSSGSKLVITYEYVGDSEVALRTVHNDYENGKLARSIEFTEDEDGNLLKSVEHFHQLKVVKTDTYTYVK